MKLQLYWKSLPVAWVSRSPAPGAFFQERLSVQIGALSSTFDYTPLHNHVQLFIQRVVPPGLIDRWHSRFLASDVQETQDWIDNHRGKLGSLG
jgi:hypothetical protein